MWRELMDESERREAIAYLMVAVEKGWLWCQNCRGHRCMSCVCRDWFSPAHRDGCKDDCPDCCGAENHHIMGSPSLGSVLDQGWAKAKEVTSEQN